MRRLIATLALAIALLACDKVPLGGYELLTGLESCYAGGESPSYAGLLVPDPEYGTRIEGKAPVMWPVGYTAVRMVDGQVSVLNSSRQVRATTGREYAMAPAPMPRGEAGAVMSRLGAIASPDCYDWDLVDCTTAIEGKGDPAVESRGCVIPPAFDLAAAKASFQRACEARSTLDGETCAQIDIGAIRAYGVYLYVPSIGLHGDSQRAQVVCGQIAAAAVGLEDGPLGYSHVTVEGRNNKVLANCST